MTEVGRRIRRIIIRHNRNNANFEMGTNGMLTMKISPVHGINNFMSRANAKAAKALIGRKRLSCPSPIRPHRLRSTFSGRLGIVLAVIFFLCITIGLISDEIIEIEA